MAVTDPTSAVEQHLSTYVPRPANGFRPQRIVLTRGSLDTSARRAFAERIGRIYPQAERVEALDRTHMQLKGLLPKGDDAARRRAGRRTLVLGTIATPLRRSEEADIVCPNYLHASPTGYCAYGCTYCYLAGSCSTIVAPAVKVYVNLEDVLAAAARRAKRMTEPTSIYVGKLQDALALDPLTGASRVLVPFFAEQPHARLVMLTKSDAVSNLLDLEHRGHTVVSWSVNPASVCPVFEGAAPPLARRLAAARRCAEAGYPVRFLIMPILPVRGWREEYAELVGQILDTVPPQRITLGGICSYPGALRLTNRVLGGDNVIAANLQREPSPDGRLRFPRELRVSVYRHLIGAIHRQAPRLPIGLCLEEADLWRACGLNPGAATCNCIW
jgi:DNA repair photolyase